MQRAVWHWLCGRAGGRSLAACAGRRRGVPIGRMTGSEHHHSIPAPVAHFLARARSQIARTRRALSRLLSDAKPILRGAFVQARRVAADLRRRRWARRTFWISSGVFAVAIVAVLGLWWRLSQGPIELDVVTP